MSNKESSKEKWLHYNQTKAELTEEEQEIRKENLECRPTMTQKGVRNLMMGICLRAVVDYRAYRRAIQRYAREIEKIDSGRGFVSKKDRARIKNLREDISECEEFFCGDIFRACTGIHGGKKAIIDAVMRIPSTYDGLLERKL